MVNNANYKCLYKDKRRLEGVIAESQRFCSSGVLLPFNKDLRKLTLRRVCVLRCQKAALPQECPW